MARRVRPTAPTPNNETSAQFESPQVNQTAVPVGSGAPVANTSFQHIPRLNMSNKNSDGPWEKLQPQYQIRRESLIEIAMRTVMLMRQNQQLQQKLAALQAETKMFMQSVMNNPENKGVALNSTIPTDSSECEIKIERNEDANVLKTEKE